MTDRSNSQNAFALTEELNENEETLQRENGPLKRRVFLVSALGPVAIADMGLHNYEKTPSHF